MSNLVIKDLSFINELDPQAATISGAASAAAVGAASGSDALATAASTSDGDAYGSAYGSNYRSGYDYYGNYSYSSNGPSVYANARDRYYYYY